LRKNWQFGGIRDPPQEATTEFENSLSHSLFTHLDANTMQLFCLPFCRWTYAPGVALRISRYVACVAALAMLSGCGEENQERVTYAPPTLAGAIRQIDVASWDAASTEASPAAIDLPRVLKRDESLAFEGRINSSLDNYPAITVLFYSPSSGTDRLTVATGMATPERAEDGSFAYRVEVKAPDSVAHCQVEIIDARGAVIGRGEVDIE
jgi:hypothetical protein